MFKTLTLSAGALVAATALTAPVAAADLPTVTHAAPAGAYAPAAAPMEQAHHKRGHRPRWHYQGRGNPHRDDYRQSYDRYPAYQARDRYGEQVYGNTRVWRGDDGRYYCRRSDGTTGLLIGAAVGGLLGRELAGGGDRTLGTIIGIIGGGLLGREIDRRQARCR